MVEHKTEIINVYENKLKVISQKNKNAAKMLSEKN